MLKRLIISSLLAAMFSGIGGIKPAGAPVQGNNDNPFIVGVFRPDGIIVPFARYANRKWSNPWHQAQPDGQPDETDTIADLSIAWYRSLVSPSGEVACPSSIWPSKLSDNVHDALLVNYKPGPGAPSPALKL